MSGAFDPGGRRTRRRGPGGGGSPGGLHRADEELGPVGVAPRVGHGQNAGSGVLQLEVLVGELLPVDGLSPGSVLLGEVTALKKGDASAQKPFRRGVK